MMLAIKNTIYELIETPKFITMYECYLNREKSYRIKIASASSWRKDAVKKLMKELKVANKTDEVDTAMRIYVAIKVLNSMKKAELRYRLIDVIVNLPAEEVFFWAWKVTATKNGVQAFKVLYDLA
ncbi:MAG: hypothetical protein QXU17_00275 [Archaeoglobaceae archaeon]